MSDITKKATSSNFQAEVLDFKGVVLVDFYADWCMPCKVLSPEIEMLAEEMQDNPLVKIAKLDTEKNMDIAQKYEITSIPNIIIFKDGQKIKQLIGVPRGNGGEAPRAVYKQLILEILAENNI
jgi:thioredoxin 1